MLNCRFKDFQDPSNQFPPEPDSFKILQDPSRSGGTSTPRQEDFGILEDDMRTVRPADRTGPRGKLKEPFPGLSWCLLLQMWNIVQLCTTPILMLVHLQSSTEFYRYIMIHTHSLTSHHFCLSCNRVSMETLTHLKTTAQGTRKKSSWIPLFSCVFLWSLLYLILSVFLHPNPLILRKVRTFFSSAHATGCFPGDVRHPWKLQDLQRLAKPWDVRALRCSPKWPSFQVKRDETWQTSRISWNILNIIELYPQNHTKHQNSRFHTYFRRFYRVLATENGKIVKNEDTTKSCSVGQVGSQEKVCRSLHGHRGRDRWTFWKKWLPGCHFGQGEFFWVNSKWQLKNRQNRDSSAGGAMGHS